MRTGNMRHEVVETRIESDLIWVACCHYSTDVQGDEWIVEHLDRALWYWIVAEPQEA